MSLWVPQAAVFFLVPLCGIWLELMRRFENRREALAVAVVAWGLYAVATVELLSIGAGHELVAPRSGHLSRDSVLLGWLPAVLVGVFLIARNRNALAQALRTARESWDSSDRWLRSGVIVTVMIAAFVGLVAIVAAPNNWDSMTYHLMRVEQWTRLGGVAHYATHYEPQLYQPPGAEMLVALGRVATGGDHLAASVQWLSFVFAILLAPLAAARLGAGALGQVLAALLVATTPMALMQASSTQNDLVAALWLLIAATLALGIDADESAAGWMLVARTMAAAGALGLAVLTKGTALLFGLPVAALLGWVVVRRAGWRRAIAIAVAAVALIAVVNAGQWLRNHDTYGSFVSAGSGGNDYVNDSFGPATIVSNLARNASNHLDMPVGALNRVSEGAIRNGLELFGIDPDDPATTFTGQRFKIGPFGPHEDHAGNFALLLLALWAVVAVLAVGAWRTRRRVAWALVIVAQVLLFCALLKWQNWHARLHLPMFVLAAPLVAVCLEQMKKRALVYAIAMLLVVASPLYVFFNYTRPLVGERSILTVDRSTQYFLPRPNIETGYRSIADELDRRRVRRLAVVAPIDQWEYPFHVLAADDRLVVFDALVENRTARYPASISRADAVACISCDERRHTELIAAGFEAIPIDDAPGKHDSRLDEVPATMELWVPGR